MLCYVNVIVIRFDTVTLHVMINKSYWTA